MITVVCGHRGVGKTTFSQRLEIYDPTAMVIDLDQEISEGEKLSVKEIFTQLGEKHFRDLEKKYFTKIISAAAEKTYFVVGGGFDLFLVPDGVEILWIRRDTDMDGRVFPNRPRLNPDLSPIEEYRERFLTREKLFTEKSTRVYTIPEGLKKTHQLEKQIFNFECNPDGFLTLLKGNLKLHFSNTIYELRTDLLSIDEIKDYLKQTGFKFVLSFRTKEDLPKYFEIAPNYKNIFFADWALELGQPADEFLKLNPVQKIISLHSSGVSDSKLQQLESYAAQALLKWSPKCEEFCDVVKALSWQVQDPKNRNILPRSDIGKWNWLRLLLKQAQQINFWREGGGSAADQPTLFQWLNIPGRIENLAAVLGSPVYHSWSPVFHHDFISKHSMTFIAVDMTEQDWPVGIKLLTDLGLKIAAVTSPLKKVAGNFVNSKTPVNSMALNQNNIWEGTNTDIAGPKSWPLWVKVSSIALWGGEGVTPILQMKAEGEIQHYSSRTGELKNKPLNILPPAILVWAAPREGTIKPPADWPLKAVVDLNYSESSMGRDIALERGIEYISGEGFFESQARDQQLFWSKYL
ncbi:MAG: shikimate kinase [Bdellovibrionota bacterium]